MGTAVDFGGLDLYVENIRQGVTASNSVGTGVASRIIRHTTGATRTLTAAQSGTTVYLDKADGVLITLPAASTANIGVTYDFVVVTSVTSNVYKISTATQNTEFMDGSYFSHDIDGTGVVGVVFTGDGTTTDNYSMNGTTTGGLAGTILGVTCTALNKWTVIGHNRGSGTVVTSFATS